MNISRYIEDNQVSATSGLAIDEMLASRVGTGQSPQTLRLYTYKSHCALVGRFQNIESELNLDYCLEHGISVNRRPTGGGAIIMGSEQLGVALAIPGKSDDSYAGVREQMARFSRGIVAGLSSLGCSIEFRRKNDLEIAGKKIAGLGLHRTPSGGLLFHASLLVDLDVPLMLNVLNTPFEKLSDKEISTVAERTTTVRREVGENLSVDEVREKILEGYQEAFQVDIQKGNYSDAELVEAQNLENSKYLDKNWIYQTTDVPDSTGKAKVKTAGGLLDVRMVLAGKMIKSTFIGGDFFTSENAIADLEQSLRWHSSQSKLILGTINKVYKRWADDLATLPQEALIRALEMALKRAEVSAKKVAVDPYGCFVSPGSVHV